jgi:hypothetical protein
MEALWSTTDALLGLSATKAEELSTLQVCFRAFVVYLVLIGYVRFAKKRFLSEATGFDAILVIVIGSIASRPFPVPRHLSRPSPGPSSSSSFTG